MIFRDIVLIGNLDLIKFFGCFKLDKIRREILKLLKKMRGYDNFLCDFGCNCLNIILVENL